MRWLLLLFLILLIIIYALAAVKINATIAARVGMVIIMFLSAMFATWLFWGSGLFG